MPLPQHSVFLFPQADVLRCHESSGHGNLAQGSLKEFAMIIFWSRHGCLDALIGFRWSYMTENNLRSNCFKNVSGPESILSCIPVNLKIPDIQFFSTLRSHSSQGISYSSISVQLRLKHKCGESIVSADKSGRNTGVTPAYHSGAPTNRRAKNATPNSVKTSRFEDFPAQGNGHLLIFLPFKAFLTSVSHTCQLTGLKKLNLTA